MSDNRLGIGDGIELAELLQFINDWLAADQDARILLDRFTGRAYSAQLLRADLYRFTAVMLASITETDQEPAAGPEC